MQREGQRYWFAEHCIIGRQKRGNQKRDQRHEGKKRANERTVRETPRVPLSGWLRAFSFRLGVNGGRIVLPLAQNVDVDRFQLLINIRLSHRAPPRTWALLPPSTVMVAGGTNLVPVLRKTMV